MATKTPATPEDRALRRLKDSVGLMWHLATYLIINGFLWFIDLLDGNITFAYWVSITWGIGIAFHLAAFIIVEDDESNPRYRRYLNRELRRDEKRQPPGEAGSESMPLN